MFHIVIAVIKRSSMCPCYCVKQVIIWSICKHVRTQ